VTDLNISFTDSLRTGFINHLIQSKREFRPKLLVNNQKEGKKVLTSVLRGLRNCDEFSLSVAFITTSGIATLINTLIELEANGVSGKILASQYLNFTEPEALKRLLQFDNIDLRIVTDGNFHSKGYIFKSDNLYKLIVGSSNLTASALCVNKEWNLSVAAAPESELILQTEKEFKSEFESALKVTIKWIEDYSHKYQRQIEQNLAFLKSSNYETFYKVRPNLMQREALLNITNLREKGHKKALLISATGTGKTYLSAFDAKIFKPKKFLFLVHRRTIAEKSMKAYRDIFGKGISMGLYSGSDREISADYIFSTVQTISRDEHLNKFSKDHFNYIVIDETHRAGAASYQKIMEYFDPDFLLGMTATPERTDGLDIFKLFNYNIAYEIRLHRALAEDMLCPFHYYGITDLTVDNQIIEDKTDFNLLTATERVNRIIEKAELYGCDDGNVRGLIFCSRKTECYQLSLAFNDRGYKTIALTGEDHESRRINAIEKLESDDPNEKLDYIFTVDIFNEGIDIPRINQIIMLRPTQSAIIFVQQLGRGLRKVNNKGYLTVIDFIGNYSNNYLVPIALYGDTSYNKDTLRNLISTGSELIPGSSTINFDLITKEKIFSAIDSANLQKKKDLVNDYTLLKFKLGHIPFMIDFIDHGSRDPYAYVNYSRSYFNFLLAVEDDLDNTLNNTQIKLLELFSNEINNAKRIEETLLLDMLINFGSISIGQFKAHINELYGYEPTMPTINSCIKNLNFGFITENHKGKKLPVSQIYKILTMEQKGESLFLNSSFKKHLQNAQFKKYLFDTIKCAIKVYNSKYDSKIFIDGFQLYRKYSRKDIFRILNWETNPVAINVGGYIISPDKTNCPIFVNYHKHDDISSTTKYEDVFISDQQFQYMSKSRRTLQSGDVRTIQNAKEGLRIPFFVKKSNDEGQEFYYLGEVDPIKDSFEETSMPADEGRTVSVVKMVFKLSHQVEDRLFDYITNKAG